VILNSESRKAQVEIIVPCFNEEENLQKLFEEYYTLTEIDRSVDYSLLIIDNCSTDKTWDLALEFARVNNRVRCISLSRNFGKEASLTAGLVHSIGDAVIPIDADLQDPISVIPLLVSKWLENDVEVVLARRNKSKNRSLMREIASSNFHKIFSYLVDFEIPENVGEFRLLDRKFVRAFTQLPESQRFVRGLFSWIGFKSEVITFDRGSRFQGKSKFKFRSLLNLGVNGITSFSIKPLRIATSAGIILSTSSFLYASLIFIRTIMGENTPSGYSSMMVTVLLLGGIQLISIGLVGEYVGRILIESKQRPIFIVREMFGVSDYSIFKNTSENPTEV
jgi:glycosyltransferase involved in cell wall biosynthesis